MAITKTGWTMKAFSLKFTGHKSSIIFSIPSIHLFKEECFPEGKWFSMPVNCEWMIWILNYSRSWWWVQVLYFCFKLWNSVKRWVFKLFPGLWLVSCHQSARSLVNMAKIAPNSARPNIIVYLGKVTNLQNCVYLRMC